MDRTDLRQAIEAFQEGRGRIAVLTGAGVSAESGIPTFRGPEGYWRVGSREYRPEQMATQFQFRQDPWELWAWYLYRRTVCLKASPNPGHQAIARMEQTLGDRFRLITQNVDGLHLRAGNSPERTFQIHGNLHFMRCGRDCSLSVWPIPTGVGPKGKGDSVTDAEKKLLSCPRCGAQARPHVLWFDERYDEALFRAESALRWAAQSDFLLVAGTSGATSLPMRIGELFLEKPQALFVDVNPHPNPFRDLALAHPRGIVLEGTAGSLLPEIAHLLEKAGAGRRSPTTES